MYWIIILVIIVIYLNWEPIMEPFYDLTHLDPNCLDCYSKSGEHCMDCANCGICIINGKGKCLPGDLEGPYYTEECDKWIYQDKKSGKESKIRKTVLNKPWNHFYPQLNLVRWSSPVFRARLN